MKQDEWFCIWFVKGINQFSNVFLVPNYEKKCLLIHEDGWEYIFRNYLHYDQKYQRA